MNDGFTAADRLELLWARGVTVSLLPGGELDIEGPAVVVDAAIPMLMKHKPEIARELRAQRKAA